MDQLLEELLTNIFECLFVRDLDSVALVCKQYARLVTPLLLLRTLVARPQLGGCVEYLAFRFWYGDEIPSVSIGNLAQSLESAAESYKGSALYPELAVQLSEPSTDAVAALVLSRLPNVRTLRLGMVPWDDDTESTVNYNCTLAIRTIEAAIATPFVGSNEILSNLTNMILDGSPGDVGFNWHIRVLSLFLRLPSLRKITATNACSGPKVAGWACLPKTSNVTGITLLESELGVDALVKTLRACKTLKTLHWHTQCLGCDAGDQDLRQALCDELATHAASLGHLSLHSRTCCAVESALAAAPGWFAKFPVLERLELGDGLCEYEHSDTAWRDGLQFSLPISLRHLGMPQFWRVVNLVDKVAATFARVPRLETYEVLDGVQWEDAEAQWKRFQVEDRGRHVMVRRDEEGVEMGEGEALVRFERVGAE
ncbi:hypothetical protein LTR36_004216 [Oleoguttula mirabilis]|uniref:F-box domain-containing protein n=1 Tax=Oleoguttula mirabilis TaxID=1507867 RepID=A0AAV9JG60_9PEZI|nr:hypothetical protein LTR36_004216 [Oleoguttula mirabilis]